MAADHYAALRVARGASPAEVRAAFTARCRALHPDAGGRAAGDELARVVEAFRVLRDPAARAAYDAGAAGGGAAWRPEDYELRRRAAAFRRAHLHRPPDAPYGGGAYASSSSSARGVRYDSAFAAAADGWYEGPGGAHRAAMRALELATRPRVLLLALPLLAAAAWVASDPARAPGARDEFEELAESTPAWFNAAERRWESPLPADAGLLRCGAGGGGGGGPRRERYMPRAVVHQRGAPPREGARAAAAPPPPPPPPPAAAVPLG